MLAAIDPGLRGCGVALFRDRFLVTAVYVANPNRTGADPKAWEDMAAAVRGRIRDGAGADWVDLVLEFPRVYPGVRRNDPNDLMQLAAVVGAIVGAMPESEPVAFFPQEWKRQVPKKVMTARIKKHLLADELPRVVSVGSLDHNTYDAVGLGLWHLGRMKAGGA
jgi:hypothetical protein